MASKTLFGTDGIRTSVCSPVLSPESVARLGRVLANIVMNYVVSQPSSSKVKSCITIGRDTRGSGVHLENALVSGIIAGGVDCHLVGVLPTSGIAMAGASFGSFFSIVISASHNTYVDNGFKIFANDGNKIDDDTESAIEEKYLEQAEITHEWALNPGVIFKNTNSQEEYINKLLASLPDELDLRGLRVVVDCANGAASMIAPKLFSTLGCTTKIIGANPNGKNINSGCGSEYTATLKQEVLDFGADLGVAFDGDADRLALVNESGQMVPGDALLAAFAIDLNKRNKLRHGTLVATIMSSVALDNALAPHGIKVTRASVGDRHVARVLNENGFSFGGEHSGHLIFAENTTTGDGIFSALQFIAMLKRTQTTTSKLMGFFRPTPTMLKNINIEDKIPLSELPLTEDAIKQANQKLNNSGRVLLRYSGTEMKARLLVEAQSDLICQELVREITQAFKEELDGKIVQPKN